VRLPPTVAAQEKDLARMCREQPRRQLPMRYGYFDIERRDNLMVTRRAQ